MSGEELIDWLSGECRFIKVPPSDYAMILVLRGLLDVDAAVRTIKHSERLAEVEKGSK